MRLFAIIASLILVIFLIVLFYIPVPSPSGEGIVLKTDEELLIRLPTLHDIQGQSVETSQVTGSIDRESVNQVSEEKVGGNKLVYIEVADLKKQIDDHPLTKSLPDVIGEMKSLFEPIKDDYPVLSNFDVFSGGKYRDNEYDYTYKLGDQILSLRIVTFKNKDGPKRQVACDTMCISSYSGLGLRGDKNGLNIGDYNFTYDVDDPDNITFVRNNVYCRVRGYSLPSGMVKGLAEDIDLKIQESKIEK